MKTCIICGKEFEPKTKNQISCGPECAIERHRRICLEHSRRIRTQETRHCSWCGKPFISTDNRRSTCSEECRAARAKEMARRRRSRRKGREEMLVLPKDLTQDERFQAYGVNYGRIRTQELLAKVPKIDTDLKA